MRRAHLSYSLSEDEALPAGLSHPLIALLAAVDDTGSISGAARVLGLSYRHVWGELKRWEAELARELVVWVKGQPAQLTPTGRRLLQAERSAQARLAPQIEAVRAALEQAFDTALNDGTEREQEREQEREDLSGSPRAPGPRAPRRRPRRPARWSCPARSRARP